MNYQLIHEEKNFLIINKPAELQVHPDSKNKKGTLVDYLIKDYPELAQVGDGEEARKQRPGIVHRLDRDTSGIMLIPRNQKSFLHFKKQFQERKVKKKYLALVHGKVKLDRAEGQINLAIGRSPKNTATRSTAPYARDKKPALTFFKIRQAYQLEIRPNLNLLFTLLEVSPVTGRTHQIRVHLKSKGFPIYGDPVYKFKRLPKIETGVKIKTNSAEKSLENAVSKPRMFLTAYSLEFKDPSGKDQHFEIPLAQDLSKILDRLIRV